MYKPHGYKPLALLTQALWFWCIAHGIWITAAHVPEKKNVVADRESRHEEWKLDPCLLQAVLRDVGVSTWESCLQLICLLLD